MVSSDAFVGCDLLKGAVSGEVQDQCRLACGGTIAQGTYEVKKGLVYIMEDVEYHMAFASAYSGM